MSSPPPTGRARAWRQAPRSRSRTPSARPDRSGRPTPFAASTTSVLAGSSTVPGVGRADRAAVRPARRGPDHRSRQPGRRAPARMGRHDRLRTGRRRCARPGAARRLPALPRAQRRSTAARSSWRPGCSPPSSGPRCTRCTASPAAPTTSSTTSTHARTATERADRLQRLATQLFNRLVNGDACGDDPALAAVVHTARSYGIAWDLFDDFLTSMRMDLTVTDYPDRAALDRYMYGSAEVIGLQLLPVLGTVGPREEAAPYAAALGKAFQLTNFLRDVDEDLQRGPDLPARRRAGRPRRRPRRADVVPREPAHRSAGAARAGRAARRSPDASTTTPGTASPCCDPRSRPCVSAALTLYSEILDRIEDIDFAIFSQRATRRHGCAGCRSAGADWPERTGRARLRPAAKV